MLLLFFDSLFLFLPMIYALSSSSIFFFSIFIFIFILFYFFELNVVKAAFCFLFLCFKISNVYKYSCFTQFYPSFSIFIFSSQDWKAQLKPPPSDNRYRTEVKNLKIQNVVCNLHLVSFYLGILFGLNFEAYFNC